MCSDLFESSLVFRTLLQLTNTLPSVFFSFVYFFVLDMVTLLCVRVRLCAFGLFLPLGGVNYMVL